MIRAILALIVLAAVAATAAWLSQNPGDVSVNWRGWRIESSAATALMAVAAVAAATAILYRVWVWLRRGPRRMDETREAERRRQGYRALSRGMVAVAAGDRDESRKLAHRAEALLEEPPLTLLLSAQAAQLSGDDTAAERYFEAMLGNHELMNIDRDFRYVSPMEFLEFVPPDQRNIEYTKDGYPQGYYHRVKVFERGGNIAKHYALQKKSITVVGSTLFVHGGLSQELVDKYIALLIEHSFIIPPIYLVGTIISALINGSKIASICPVSGISAGLLIWILSPSFVLTT